MTDPGEGAQPPYPAPPVPPVPPHSAPRDPEQLAAPPVPQYAAPPHAVAPQAPQYPSAANYPVAPNHPAAPQYAAPQAPYAGYAQPAQAYGPYVPQPQPVAAPSRAPGLGVVAFLLGLLAAVVAPIVGATAVFNGGAGISASSLSSIEQPDASFDWSILTPVREWVLWAEISFWAGTILGIWALAQGIVAIAKKRGRGWGITAVVLAVIGSLIFFGALTVSGFAGLAAGSVPLS